MMRQQQQTTAPSPLDVAEESLSSCSSSLSLAAGDHNNNESTNEEQVGDAVAVTHDDGEDDEEMYSVDRGSVISGLGTCCSANDEGEENSYPILNGAEINAISSIVLDPDSCLPDANSSNKAPSSLLMNDERSMLSCSTKPDPPPSVAGDQDMSLLGLLGDESEQLVAANVEENVLETDGVPREPRDASASSVPDQNDDSAAAAHLPIPPTPIVEMEPQPETPSHEEENTTMHPLLRPAAPNTSSSSPQPPYSTTTTVNGGDSIIDTSTTTASAFVLPRRETASSALVGPDNLMLLPAVDEERLPSMPRMMQPTNSSSQLLYPSQQQQQQQYVPQRFVSTTTVPAAAAAPTERRKIQLRLQEDVVMKTRGGSAGHVRNNSLLGSAIRKTRMWRFSRPDNDSGLYTTTRVIDRGTIFVSWYPGTSTLELYQHVRRSVVRKVIKKESMMTTDDIEDLRILDESSDPPEEIVLSPYIPDGSRFLLRFSVDNDGVDKKGMATPLSKDSTRPPVSPSAAPSPNPANNRQIISNLNENQIALLGSLQTRTSHNGKRTMQHGNDLEQRLLARQESKTEPKTPTRAAPVIEEGKQLEKEEEKHGDDDDDDEKDDAALHSSDPIESTLRDLMELLVTDRRRRGRPHESRQREKRQVIFVVANYFALFVCLIYLSAELQARVPEWLKMMEAQLKNVRNCSEDQEALFECVSRGEFSGLIASVGLWLSRSVVTKRIFLFGFDTPKKLWTVVYESLVTSICWGISYLFIRRGMNPDTRHRFVQKYWKDAVYGSLAGFNAAFLKQILKNLIPQDVVEDAIRERQLRILGWLPSFA